METWACPFYFLLLDRILRAAIVPVQQIASLLKDILYRQENAVVSSS